MSDGTGKHSSGTASPKCLITNVIMDELFVSLENEYLPQASANHTSTNVLEYTPRDPDNEDDDDVTVHDNCTSPCILCIRNISMY